MARTPKLKKPKTLTFKVGDLIEAFNEVSSHGVRGIIIEIKAVMKVNRAVLGKYAYSVYWSDDITTTVYSDDMDNYEKLNKNEN